ncbi:GNAT family N-acetyltransferase [Psychrosphaera haliotis]|uniref:GNAT family N-acetyltransferase n=1 Tax=Psychrosphaera haliotis TaxID=555083 RepID=A0A6N8FDK2_9GAMM|nr:GNAT family N-acetyltransferase [Psychrosphaera haliotis]MUH73669.1 GNAT family N-acetyltransferase [Psychrosphaera haliotis]
MLNPTIQVIPLSDYPLDKLEQEWNSLFNRSADCFFLSWNWIGSWLSILPTFDDVYVVRAVNCSHSNTNMNGTIVNKPPFDTGALNGYALDDLLGFGIFCETKVRRHGFVKSKQWHLHRTGNEKLDQIWIEYNDFLLAETSAVNTETISSISNKSLSSQQIRTSMWQSLLTSQPRTQNVDEFIVNVAQTKWFEQLQSDLTSGSTTDLTNDLGRFKYLTSSRQPGYKHNIEGDFSEQYPSLISKSAYKNIAKSHALLKGQSKIECKLINDIEQVAQILEEQKGWHVAKWQNSLTPSGFENRSFLDFHQQLIKQNAQYKTTRCQTMLNVMYLNDEIVAINYLLVNNTTMHFYLSCIKPLKNNKIKIGLLLHQESVRLAKSEGLLYYDYMAGEARYKSQLAEELTSFGLLTIQKPKISFFIESTLSCAKHFWLDINQRK